MLRRFSLSLLVFLTLPALAGTTFPEWGRGSLHLTAPEFLDVGTLPAQGIRLSQEGTLSLEPLGPVTLELGWRRIGWLSFLPGALYLRVRSHSTGVRPQAVEWRRAGEADFHALASFGKWITIRTFEVGDASGSERLEFRYLPDVVDPPGTHRLELEFMLKSTLLIWPWKPDAMVEGDSELEAGDWTFGPVHLLSEAPVEKEEIADNSTLEPYKSWTFSVSRIVNLGWDIPAWCVLSVPATTVDLGTIGPELYDPVTGKWQKLRSREKSLYMATNVLEGLHVQVSAESAGPTPVDLSRLSLLEVPLDGKHAIFSASKPGVYALKNLVYEYLPSWTDPPGTYTVRVTFTALAP